MKMKQCTTIVLAALLSATAFMANAEQKIAVVDIRTALLSTKSAKAFGNTLKKDFQDEEQRLREVGEAAQKLQDRLKKDAAILSDVERSQLNSELEGKAQEFNFLKNKYQSAIAKREELFLQESKPKVDEAIKKIAEKENIDLILPSKLVVHANADIEITAKLIEALNSN